MTDDLNGLDEPDPLIGLIADIDQYVSNAKHMAAILAADYHALVNEGVKGFDAAVIVAMRYRSLD